MVIQTLSQNIATFRAARGLSIDSLAAISGLSPDLIRGLERGESGAMGNLDLLQFYRLARAVKCDPAALLEGSTA